MLVPTEQFTAKIRIAKEAQRSTDFAVIARTEALVAGLGMAEALERAARYADAGATSFSSIPRPRRRLRASSASPGAPR